MSIVGRIYNSNNYGQVLVLEVADDLAEVQFLNTGNVDIVKTAYLRSGAITDWEEKLRVKWEKEAAYVEERNRRLLTPSVQGVGYRGIGPLVPLKREVTAWRCMLRRCYSQEWHDLYPQYADCEVCDRWKNLQHFVEDFRKLENYDKWLNGGYQLDKDIKFPGNKVYSPDTCSLVTDSENKSEAFKRMNEERKTRRKIWEIQCPDGVVVVVKSLAKFCRERGLSYQLMIGALSERTECSSYKGYSAPQK